jgi:hypothetical protein
MLQLPVAAVSRGNSAAGEQVHLEDQRVGPHGTSLNSARRGTDTAASKRDSAAAEGRKKSPPFTERNGS